MFLQVAILFIYATVLAVFSGQEDVVYPSLETSSSGMKKLRAVNREIELRLVPAGEVAADNFTTSDSNLEYSVDVASMKRKLYSDVDTDAALHVDEDGPAAVNGFRGSDMRTELIVSEKMSTDNRGVHRITKLFQNESSLDGLAPPYITESSKRKVESRHTDYCKQINYLILTDGNFTAKFGSEENLTKYVTTKMIKNGILLKSLNLDIKVRVSKIIMLRGGEDSSFIENSYLEGNERYIDPKKLIANANEYFCKNRNKDTEEASVIFLFIDGVFGVRTSYGGIYEGYKGVSNIGGACNQCKKVGAIVDNALPCNSAKTLAQETARLLGSPNDGKPSVSGIPGSPGSTSCLIAEGYLMGSVDYPNDKKFSQCSRKNIANFLNLDRSDCIKLHCSLL